MLETHQIIDMDEAPRITAESEDSEYEPTWEELMNDPRFRIPIPDSVFEDSEYEEVVSVQTFLGEQLFFDAVEIDLIS